MVKEIIKLVGIDKDYNTESKQFSALKGINLSIKKGEFISVVGKSGSGKSTLLNIISAIDKASSGEVLINGQAIGALQNDEIDSWRGKNIGLVFQFFQLIPTLNAIENILIAMDFCEIIPADQRLARARELLDLVGLSDKEDKFPEILSGGEKQRLAIARSLANKPPILLADEPTGNLDSATAQTIFKLFKTLNIQGQTVIIVTHDQSSQEYSSRTIRIADGLLVKDSASGEKHA